MAVKYGCGIGKRIIKIIQVWKISPRATTGRPRKETVNNPNMYGNFGMNSKACRYCSVRREIHQDGRNVYEEYLRIKWSRKCIKRAPGVMSRGRPLVTMDGRVKQDVREAVRSEERAK